MPAMTAAEFKLRSMFTFQQRNYTAEGMPWIPATRSKRIGEQVQELQ